tara:strand:- start:337 stop:789 length:453 start_codon:yes stop_codon:yes gene_type:complete
MPARIINFLHDSTVAPSPAPALGTAFNAADVHAHDLQTELPAFQRDNRNFRGIIEGIHVRLVSGAAPSATKVTLRVCMDAAGDRTLVPDTEASLVAGITDATTQCAALSVNLPLFQLLAGPGNGFLYLFAKVDDATVAPDFTETVITWRE